MKNLKPKPLIYPALIFSSYSVYALYQVIDTWQQESDYSTEALLFACLAVMWITQPRHLRYRDVGAATVLVFCAKAVWFVDRENSLNFKTDQTLLSMKEFVLNQPVLNTFLPLVFQVFTESKITRLYKFGKVHAFLSHCLTAMVSAYFWFKFYYKPEDQPNYKVLEKEYLQTLQELGLLIYQATFAIILISFLNYKLYLNKSWEYQSVLIGIYLTKAAMLVAVQGGPLLYACMLAQYYAFANIINHRCDSKPGATFAIHCLFVWYMMLQYFLRGSHRQRINSVQYGKVCPGGVYCGEILHWCLIFWELLAPYLICLFLLPLVVKARIKDAYAHTKKDVFKKG